MKVYKLEYKKWNKKIYLSKSLMYINWNTKSEIKKYIYQNP